MRADQDKSRRGEPVLIIGAHGITYTPPLLGTIEWGNDREGYSVCTEPAGARFQAQKRDIQPDPGGSRPLWERRRAEDGEAARAAQQMLIDEARCAVIEAAMAREGFRPAAVVTDNLFDACMQLHLAERKLLAVERLGVRNTTEDT